MTEDYERTLEEMDTTGAVISQFFEDFCARITPKDLAIKILETRVESVTEALKVANQRLAILKGKAYTCKDCEGHVVKRDGAEYNDVLLCHDCWLKAKRLDLLAKLEGAVVVSVDIVLFPLVDVYGGRLDHLLLRCRDGGLTRVDGLYSGDLIFKDLDECPICGGEEVVSTMPLDHNFEMPEIPCPVCSQVVGVSAPLMRIQPSQRSKGIEIRSAIAGLLGKIKELPYPKVTTKGTLLWGATDDLDGTPLRDLRDLLMIQELFDEAYDKACPKCGGVGEVGDPPVECSICSIGEFYVHPAEIWKDALERIIREGNPSDPLVDIARKALG